jgi:hypothetical protein
MIPADTLRLSVRLEGPTARYVARQPAKILLFVDYVQTAERIVRTPNETIELPIGAEPGQPRVVSLNWQSEYGPLAPNSIHVTRQRAGIAAGTGAERTESNDGRP